MKRLNFILQLLYGLSNVARTMVFFTVSVLTYVMAKLFIFPPSPNAIAYDNNNFYVLNLNIPGDLNFCGEKIPSNDYDIKEALDKEFFSNAYWKNNSVALFNKTQRWFPYIEPILKQEGVPDDFKYLAFIESHLSNATSPMGAAGFWQLVPVSARNYGLEVNDEVDERYHVERATHAACKHLKDAYAVFNNWTLAAAAYNLGIGGVQQELQRQNTDNYYDLMLNPETGSFVYRILAYKTLFSNPAHFGIKNKKRSYFSKIQFTTFKVDSSINNLPAFAKHIGSSKTIIKAFNPWLLKDVLHNPEHRLYEIRIPKNDQADYSSYIADLASRQTYAENPASTATAAVETPSAPVAMPVVESTRADSVPMVKKTAYYVVKVDEPLKAIADQHHVKVEDIKKWNNLGETDEAQKGQVLMLHYYVPRDK